MSETRLHQNLWQYTGKTYQPYSDFWKLQLAQLEAPFLLEGISQAGLFSQGEKPTYQLELNETATQTINAIAKKDDLGTYVVVVSGIAYLLSRYRGKSTVLIDSPPLKASLADEAMVEQVPLIAKVDEQNSLKAYIAEFSQIISKSYSYQNFPWRELIATDETKDYLKTNVIAWLPQIHGSCSHLNNYDWGIEIRKEATLSLVVHYNPRRFDRFFVNSWTQHLQNLFSAYANRDTCLIALEILAEEEKNNLLVDWAVGKKVDGKPQTIQEVFEAQVAQTPQLQAIQTSSGSMTYKELDERANQLAHYLQTQYNIQANHPIGVMLERSERLIIGLLAILKAGGTYVPIAGDHPSDRLEFLIRDAGIKVLLMELDKLPHLQNVLDIPMFAMDVQLAALEQRKNAPSCQSQPSDNAYILYTSGSTGTPKGVMVEHHSFVNMASSQIDAFGIQPTDRVLQFANATFDASLSEIFMALFSGAALVLIDKPTIGDRKHFLAYLDEHKVTVATFPPSYLRSLEQPDFKYLRVMITAGETAQLEDARYYAHQLDYFNAYGLTETAVCATYYKVHPEAIGAGAIPIGQAIPNTAVYLLDQWLRPVPIGVTGEICVAGKGLARGYLHNPELTATKFVENPLLPGEVLYRTGDFGKRLPSGDIIFLGRQDHQVKIRGYRIELGEIEAAVCRHPEVKQAVVLARTGHDGNQEIVAYVVGEPGLSSSELRVALSDMLPEYMVPGVFVLLEELPMNANGKIDRRALPKPETSDRNLQKSFDAPRNPTEEVIAAIWAEVLGLEQIGIYDNFFDIGGHSLNATQLISRIREAFSVELPQRSLFEAPTIAELSSVVEASPQTELEVLSPAIEPIPRNEPLPLSFAQQRLWFLDQLDRGNPTYNISAAVLLTGTFHSAALEQAVAEIVRRHETLRTTFSTIDGSPVQAIAPTVTVTVPVLDLQSLLKEEQSHEVQRLATEEARRPFDLVNGLLLRVTLLALAQEEHVLLVTMHHIVSDGWSMGIFLRELSALYDAFCIGAPSPLPELPIQYADFAVWQRQWLSEEKLETQLNYWKKQLAGMHVLKLPTNQPEYPVQPLAGTRQSLELPKTLTSELQALSRREGVTLFMTLVAAFKILLHYYTRQDDIVIGTDLANRNRAETEGIIGFFVNQLVLRTDLSFNPTFKELLARVREVALGAYAHQDLPFDRLVAALNPERNLNRTPLFQTKFVLQNAPMPALELSGLTLNLLQVDNKTAKFDLLLTMWNTEKGLAGILEYTTNLFDSTTIAQMLENFQTILYTVVTQPDVNLNALAEVLEAANRYKQVAKQKEFQEARRRKFKSVKPKLIDGAKLEVEAEL